MNKTRLEAFSDGVIAILITIMVLELKIPHGDDIGAIVPLMPVFLSYVLSFVYLGIYWNNHHHMFQTARHINGKIMWANLHLLFWLSLIPFTTGWMGENHFAQLPTAAYGLVLLCAALAYTVLQALIISHHKGEGNELARAIGHDLKGRLSIVFYVTAIIFAFINQWVSDAIYVAAAAMWIVPDPRIEKRISHETNKKQLPLDG